MKHRAIFSRLAAAIKGSFAINRILQSITRFELIVLKFEIDQWRAAAFGANWREDSLYRGQMLQKRNYSCKFSIKFTLCDQMLRFHTIREPDMKAHISFLPTCTRLGLAVLLALCSTATFAQWNFANCSATGAIGPTQVACDTAYSGTNLAGKVTVTAGIQSWTVPTTGTYRISAVGGQGASADPARLGGRGAELRGDFTLSAGSTLQIAVGQQGLGQSSDGSGGGGGGSFVVGAGNNPLLVAGGGGGTRAVVDQNGCDASITEYGIRGSAAETISSCTQRDEGLRQGGIASAGSWGAGGAGFDTNGQNDSIWGTGGRSWLNGLSGGTPLDECGSITGIGGFGGGGSGNGCHGGGGGGGYSGGEGGRLAGGGGSYNTGSNSVAAISSGSGAGKVVITLLSAPVVSASPVPVISSGGLVALTLLLALAGIYRARRGRDC